MRIKLNDKGFISEFALIGNLADSIDVPDPSDIEHFLSHYAAYGVKDGALNFDDAQDAENEEETVNTELRARRETECFKFINRGQLWYAMLNVKQLAELTTWYKAWLNVTETKVVPERPAWLD